jgi:hypothetical protein
MVDVEAILSIDSWTERAEDDSWVLGDEDKVEPSVPLDLEVMPWYENNSDDQHIWSGQEHQA